MRTKLSIAKMSVAGAVPSASSPLLWMCRAISNGAGQRSTGQRVQRSRAARHASSAAGRSDRSAPSEVAEIIASWRGPRRASLAQARGERGTVEHVHAMPQQPVRWEDVA
jgi:hypothetical protein